MKRCFCPIEKARTVRFGLESKEWRDGPNLNTQVSISYLHSLQLVKGFTCPSLVTGGAPEASAPGANSADQP